ncbi:hypothetical protein ACGFH8_29915 [Micromonospora sp. NPDC049175]|uniref:hypothetical protein n=1 Tax=Micromonospora sp. NPDC049175 TaxID=3364266 RepID=UPI00372254A7
MSMALVQREDKTRIDELSAAVAARRFRGVTYFVPPGLEWVEEDSPAGAVHVADMGVSLRFDDLTFNVAWSMNGFNEGLAVATDPVDPLFFGRSAVAVDASAIPPWPSRLGHAVEGISWAWHQPGDDCPELLWAVRFDFGVTGSAVIALGEVDDGTPRYMPDSLLVLFDENLARSYVIPAGESSSWGA